MIDEEQKSLFLMESYKNDENVGFLLEKIDELEKRLKTVEEKQQRTKTTYTPKQQYTKKNYAPKERSMSNSDKRMLATLLLTVIMGLAELIFFIVLIATH